MDIMGENRNPYIGNITHKYAVLCLSAAGYSGKTIRGMLKGYVHEKLVDPEEVPDHVNSLLLQGHDELEYLMQECREELGT